jgi:hypothetical protein
VACTVTAANVNDTLVFEQLFLAAWAGPGADVDIDASRVLVGGYNLLNYLPLSTCP